MEALFAAPLPAMTEDATDASMTVDKGTKRRLTTLGCKEISTVTPAASFGTAWATDMLMQLAVSNLRLQEEKCQRSREENVTIKASDTHVFMKGMAFFDIVSIR